MGGVLTLSEVRRELGMSSWRLDKALAREGAPETTLIPRATVDRWRRTGLLCTWPTCAVRLGRFNDRWLTRCEDHVKRIRAVFKVGDKRPTPDGYVNILTDAGWRLEHRVLMAQTLGRPMRPGENVHHINGIKSDNSPQNLELWVSPQPAGQRVADLVSFVVDNYPDEVYAAIELAVSDSGYQSGPGCQRRPESRPDRLNRNSDIRGNE